MLYQYSVSEEGAATGPDNVAKCVFTPPKNAIFYLVHAVGGGGGSSTYNGSYSLSSNQTETKYYYSPNDFPKWLRDIQGANKLPAGATTFNTSIKGSKATIRYGRSGKAGETMSLFFPRLRDLEIEMYPGKGGVRGAAGSKTEVWFNMASATGIKRTRVIEVNGGAAGSGSGSTVIWVDGENTMCAIKENDEVGYRAADFSGNVELDKGSLMESKMEEVEFGSGGAGSYGNVTQTTSATYYVNGYNLSSYVQKPDCIQPRVCGDGTTSNPCVGQAGRNGAVVILW